ncbi:MAG: IS200/IS605 family transposase [Verrucomicrobia bacterium]|nr:IS200/IS605 family transposase [Verrucomicrobiota bacterium]MCH8527778.1 IS200/IS605 family transposase [Kiritimatiellia bacterium]
MPQSHACVLLHIIFSTKDRHPWLHDNIRPQTHAFLAGVVRKCDCEAYRVGGVTDHIHLAVRHSRTLPISDLIQEIKTASSKWIKTQAEGSPDFAWQNGYGAFSLGMSQKETLLRYIDRQEEHHRTQTFQDEYRAFLRKYGIEFDERYVWD